MSAPIKYYFCFKSSNHDFMRIDENFLKVNIRIENCSLCPTEMPSKTMPTCDIIDLWEAAGIIQPKKLMSSLGFEEEIVSISLLSNALEEELRTCPNESEMLLKVSV